MPLIDAAQTMETDSSYGDRSEVSEEESSADDNSKPGARPHSLHGTNKNITKAQVLASNDSRSANGTESKEEHWQRLQNHYSDQYLNLLNESCVDGVDSGKTDLDSTQVGSIIWAAQEKEKFFCALSRKSKAGIRDVAKSIGTKSELEVYHYLRLLEDEDRNRHLCAGDISNVSYAEIPAAAELSSECEALLEKAADALSVYQDRFDRAVGEQTHHESWLIDHVQAKAHDALVDDAEYANSSEGSPSSPRPILPDSLFKLSSWLSLSERIFMNSDPSRSDSNWAIHAIQDDVPAFTQEAISDLHELALCRLRKVMQTSIFCAESRIRSTNDRGYTAKGLVKEQDVAAAISVLGLQEGRSEFWIKLARRNHLRVVDDHRKKSSERRTVLKYDEVERILKESSGSRQRRRSASSASETSSFPADLDHIEEDYDVSDGIEDTDSPMSDQSAGRQSWKQDRRPPPPLPHGDERGSADRIHKVINDGKLDPGSSGEGGISIFDDDEDNHLETIDQINSRRQEILLYHDLGWPIPEDAELDRCEELKAQEPVLRMTQRKARPDLCGWRDAISSYLESWEECGQCIDEAQFVENQRPSKRRKTRQATGEKQDLSFRAPR